ncbi:hypothetical protein GGR50DRAFT_681812 [Xylaria sp. CBS 124048]|nr:hypothetical protein GGR50DRAFT_681812 [Xylaria sp. CBS 124048]
MNSHSHSHLHSRLHSHSFKRSSRDEPAGTSEAATWAMPAKGGAPLLIRSKGRHFHVQGPLQGVPLSNPTARATKVTKVTKVTKSAIFLLICCFLSLLSISAAAASLSVHSHYSLPTTIPTKIVAAREDKSAANTDADAATVTATVTETERAHEILLVDPHVPVYVNGHWQIMSDEEQRELSRRYADAGPDADPENYRRQARHAESSSGAVTTSQVVINVSTIPNPQAPMATATTPSTPLPSPFDGALAANFSDQKCPDFINSFLSNGTFKACYPMSLLLQGSQSFFAAEKSRFDITQVLDTACGAQVGVCTNYFTDLATRLIVDDSCGKEFHEGNALVTQAYQGMEAYKTLFDATCLHDADDPSSNYCFTNAVTNPTTASDSYLYFLPLNMSLPTTSSPNCSACTRQTMQIYQAATANRKADIAFTYQDAAEHINSQCGNNFTNVSLAAVARSDGTLPVHPAASSSLLFISSFTLMAISHWIF